MAARNPERPGILSGPADPDSAAAGDIGGQPIVNRAGKRIPVTAADVYIRCRIGRPAPASSGVALKSCVVAVCLAVDGVMVLA